MSAHWQQLRPGDRVRLLHVPASDLAQRDQERRDRVEMAGWTADTLERIIARHPLVTIERVDDYGAPWFEFVLPGEAGVSHFHSLNITDDESWELAYTDPLPQPSPEMFKFYEDRTRQHIALVASNLQRLTSGSPYADELAERAAEHDASKFGRDEFVPYVWLTEFYRSRKHNKPFAYPAGVEAEVKSAVRHHVLSNRHHPEFHDDPNDMTEIDLIEMVCDWATMAQEFQQDGGSARGWADKTIGARVPFNAAKSEFVYRTIAELDRRNQVGT